MRGAGARIPDRRYTVPVTDIAIVLASASPQRSLLLSELGVAFVVAPSSVDEDAHPELIPAKRAAILAEEKARDVAPRHPGSWVIGCDTLVEAADGALLEKAKDAAEARAMLDRMSGKTCLVHSGLFVLDPAGVGAGGLSSRVTRRSNAALSSTSRAGTRASSGRSRRASMK